jgi:activator of HSP90 ATPase
MKRIESLPTRRRVMGGIGAALGGVVLAPRSFAQTTASDEKNSTGMDTAHTTSLRQEIELKATPQRVFEILLDAKEFGVVTGMAAEIDPEVGGAFKTFGGLIEGRNVEIVPAQRIVQAWREASWEPGYYSLVHFELKAQGAATLLVLDHTGFHPGDFVHLNPGWPLRYWDPLKKCLASQG